MSKKGKKGMRQNHSRSADETKELIRQLAIERDMTVIEICNELELGYSTVMKYRKQIQREIDNNSQKDKEEVLEPMENQKTNVVSFRIKQETFDVEVRQKRGANIYKLSDIKQGVNKFYSIDIDTLISKTTDEGEEFIYGTYLIPIANKILDHSFTSSVKDCIFDCANDYVYNSINDMFNTLIGFMGYSSQEDREELLQTQDALLQELDNTDNSEELSNIFSKIKNVRLEIKELNREEKVREILNNSLNSTALQEIKKDIQGLSL